MFKSIFILLIFSLTCITAKSQVQPDSVKLDSVIIKQDSISVSDSLKNRTSDTTDSIKIKSSDTTRLIQSQIQVNDSLDKIKGTKEANLNLTVLSYKL